MTLKEHSPIPDGDHDPAVPRASLDPDPETMRQLGYELIDRVVDHLATLSEQPVARRGTLEACMGQVDEPLPEGPCPLDD